jgi:hypothetical protein
MANTYTLRSLLMKKLLTFVLSLTPALLFSQELTADTAAVEPSVFSQVAEALWAGLAIILGFLSTRGLPLLNAWLKQVMHFRGAGVVADAFTQALGELSLETQKALSDGVITRDEWKVLKIRAREIALSRLNNLSGFYKADLVTWVDDQLDVLLGKFLLRI